MLLLLNPLSRERRIQEEREREAEAARQLEARVVEAFEAALVDRADDLKAELERRYQAEIDRRVRLKLDEIEREYQRKLEEEKRLEVGCFVDTEDVLRSSHIWFSISPLDFLFTITPDLPCFSKCCFCFVGQFYTVCT